MSTTAIVALGILAVLALLAGYAYLRIRAKIRAAISAVRVAALEAAVKELKEKQGKAQEPDQKLNELTARVEETYNRAKAAHDSGDYAAVAKIADPVLKELIEILKKQAEAEEAARKQAQEEAARRQSGDGSQEPPAALPAPGEEKKGDEPKD